MLMKTNKEKRDKLTEKAFMQSIVVSVIGIFMCIVALCSTSWAWFSETAKSTSNIIKAANCDMTILVQTAESEEPVNVEATDGKYTLYANTTYIITLKAVGTADSAYATLNIDGETYYTTQFNVTSYDTNPEEFTFELQFSKDTVIEIVPHWGTSSKTERKFDNAGKYSNLVSVQN